MIEHLSIRGRIVFGYVVVLGIAVAGASTGLVVGNGHQRDALDDLQQVTAERTVISDLQVRILNNHPTKQLSPYLDTPLRFRAELDALLERIVSVQALLSSYKTLVADSGHGIDETQQALDLLLLDYEATVQTFRSRTEMFAFTMDNLGQMSDEVAKQQLLAFVQSPEFGDFIALPSQLAVFSEHLTAQDQQAAMALTRAGRLRMQIIVLSLLMSVAIATLVAVFTSTIIAQPIEAVIRVAHRVTDENDFDLQVPTTGVGELGRLATALNQLIRQVKLLLVQLRQKNTDLSQALTQVNEQQSQLVQSEKMSSLGQLVAGVAHEINNPVTFIHGNLTYVKNYSEDLLGLLGLYQTQYPHPVAAIQHKTEDMDLGFIQVDLPKTLASMAVGTERIRKIVLSLRNFSRKDEADAKRANLHEGLDSTLVILKQHLSDIELVQDYGHLPEVDCYPGQLNQVFMNVLTNAIDALREFPPGEGSKITLRTSVIVAGEWVEVAIADNGPGIPQAIQTRIFDPFFTTKVVGKGTGLGMSISYQIVTEKHGGKLLCRSKMGQGTEFVIQIPIAQAPAAAGPKAELKQP